MSEGRILIAGIGNIFLGDDAFGVEVVQRLMRRPQPEGVRVVDFGIRGLDLAYALLEPYDGVILIDAMPRGGQPGTLYVLEPEPISPATEPAAIEGHNLDPVRVLQMTAALGGPPQRLVVVGCEPQPLDEETEVPTMSDAVQAVLDEAVRMVETLAEKMLTRKEMPLCPK